jgi:hypothetical protein
MSGMGGKLPLSRLDPIVAIAVDQARSEDPPGAINNEAQPSAQEDYRGDPPPIPHQRYADNRQHTNECNERGSPSGCQVSIDPTTDYAIPPHLSKMQTITNVRNGWKADMGNSRLSL